jgi:plastocyanin
MSLPRTLVGLGLALGISIVGTAAATVTVAAPAEQGVRVEMVSTPAFQPSQISVPVGTTVTWVDVSGTHTTTSYDGLWDSGEQRLEVGQTYSHTFAQPGVYRYYCRPHEDRGMVGTVIVTGGPKG